MQDHVDADSDAALSDDVEFIECWRCSLPVAIHADECHHCHARPKRVREGLHATSLRRDEYWPLKALLYSYVALLATGIAHAAALDARFGDVDSPTAEMLREAKVQVAVVEAIDTAIVIIAFAVLGSHGRRPTQPEMRSLWIWPASFPLLAGMLAINVAYHGLLRHFIGITFFEERLMEEPSLLALLTTCVQPAIVEEAYCRGLAVRVLREFLGLHGVVWITALMFGLMHVSVMLSIPYLILFGVFVGYVRMKSGAVWLPMLLHFLHNLAITLYEWNF